MILILLPKIGWKQIATDDLSVIRMGLRLFTQVFWLRDEIYGRPQGEYSEVREYNRTNMIWLRQN
jgi:hypothetical protein